MEALIASVVLPAVIDLFKGAGGAISRKFLGLSVDDQIKIETAQVEKLKALAELDNPHGTPSQWVVDLRASFRYIAACIVILLGAAISILGWYSKDAQISAHGLEIAGMPFGFIFGERMYLGFKGSKK